MQPSTSFVVSAYGGEYDDAWEDPVALAGTVELAQAFIDDEEKRFNEIVDKVQEFLSAYSKENGSIPFERELDRPRWPPGLPEASITPEMRSRNTQAWQSYQEARFVAKKEFLASLGVELDVDSQHSYERKREVQWRIKEVPWV